MKIFDFKMFLNIYIIYYFSTSLVFCSMFRDRYSVLYKSNESKLKSIILEITKTWATHDITLISHTNHSLDDKVKQVTEEISSAVLPFHPTRYFQTSNLSQFFTVNNHLAATSRTLVILVHRSRLARRTEKLARCLRKISHVKHSPKVLLVLIADEEEINMEEELTKLWKMLYPYVIALEIPASFNEHDKLSPIYVHRYRQHPSSYSRKIYNGDVSDWYTDQFQNISGTELKLCLYNTSRINNELLKVELQVIEKKLNVSVNAVIPKKVMKKCGMTYNLFYLLHNAFYSSARDHSAPIFIDRFCLFVPTITKRVHAVESWGLIIASVLGIIIVIVILGFSTLTNIETFKRPFNVVAVVLGVSLSSMKLPRFVEKIMYLCLVHVATRYTSMLYTELFNEVAVGLKEIKINDFDDLYGLNLTIAMSRSMYNFFISSNNIPDDLLPMFRVVNDETKNLGGKVGYFSLQIVEMLQRKLQKKHMKKTKLCIGSVTVVHMMAPKWQYKERVNDLLWRINEHGFREHEYAGIVKENYVEEEIEEAPNAQRRMMLALLYGYVVVVVVFMGELVYGWILRKKRVETRSKEGWKQR